MGKRIAIEVAPQHARRKGGQHRTLESRRPPAFWMLISLAGIIAVSVGWVAVRGVIAKGELEAAVPLAQTIKSSLFANEPEKAASELATLQRHTSSATALTGDPVWRAFEFVPVLGPNLTAFREAAEVIDRVSVKALKPVVVLAGTIDISSFKPIDGQVNLRPILDAQSSVATADDEVLAALIKTRAIDTSMTVSPVTAAIKQLDAVLADASSALGSVRTAVNLLPGMLGVDGPRNYLLMFQNNAETRALGGNPASLALVHIDNGKIDLQQQSSSTAFSTGISALDVGSDYLNLYANNLAPGSLTGNIQNVTAFPDFSVAATIAQAMWERASDQHIDAVVSFDPVALSYLLGATGPIVLPSGDALTADNAVSLLLSDVYARYTDPAVQDQFFADAAKAVFDTVKSGAGDSKTLLKAMARSVNEGRLLVWSEVPDEEAVIKTTDFSGIMPLDNKSTTDVGVYFNDFTTAKLNYYMDAVVDVSAPVCKAAEGFTSVYTVTLTSRVPMDAATSLPPYVIGGSPDGTMREDVVVMGPIGATYTDTDMGNSGGQIINSGTDKGRPVVRVNFFLAPGESKTIKVTMTSPPGRYGLLKIKTTPLVTPTKVTDSSGTCK